jgi:hypothetical protein
MSDKMTYQQARRIRNKDYSLSKLITQNIRRGDMSAGGAIKAAFKEKFDVGTRLKAKMTGIKEKFDPLNIAKFLTFGSNVAPALLGRMTGRSKEDIRNFTGGRQTYEDYVKPTATKIGKLEGDDSGLNDVLNKIYTFMKSNQEDDIKHQELQNNRREEELLESDKKHKELLAALSKLTGNKVEGQTASKVEPEQPKSLLDSFMDMFGMGKDIFGILRTVGPLLANPLVLGLLGAIAVGAGMMYLLSTDKNPEETSKGIINAGAADGGLAETIMNANEDVVAARKNQLLAGRTGDEWSLFGDDEKKKAYLEKIGWDEKSATTKADRDAGIIGYDSEGVPIRKKMEATPVSSQTSMEEASQARSDFAKTDPRMIGSATEAEAASGASANLVNATNENNNLKLNELTSTPATTNINSTTTNSRKVSQPNGPLPPVRNLEDTFQRMILNSTRVV